MKSRSILFGFLFVCLFLSKTSAQTILGTYVTSQSSKDYSLLTDTSFVNLVEFPFIGIKFNINSAPGFKSFISSNQNIISVNFDQYANNIEIASQHLMDMKNTLLYYAYKRSDQIYSFGIDHRLFVDCMFSHKLISLLINGNYQYLNQNLTLDDKNYISALNYLSFYFGYSSLINERLYFNSKIKFIKGLGSMNLDLGGTQFLLNENFNSEHNPFDIELISNFSFDINHDHKTLSNLGVAVDLYAEYEYTSRISMYANINDLGIILWNEQNNKSQGTFYFDGIDYSLDQVLSTEFENLQDTIINIFSTESHYTNKVRLMPYSTNLGLTYDFVNENQINFNMSIQNLYKSMLYSVKISYLKYFPKQKFKFIPSFSINKYNFANLSISLNKKWANRYYTNIFVNNIIDLFTPISEVSQVGFGWEVYMLF